MEAILKEGPWWETAPLAEEGLGEELEEEAEAEGLRQSPLQARRREDMLSRLRLSPDRPREHEFERRLRGAEEVAKLLRQRVTLPADQEEQGNWQQEAVLLPPVCCAFVGCTGVPGVDEADGSEQYRVDLDECDLRAHILHKHRKAILEAAEVDDEEGVIYDIYREALAIQERKRVPAVGPAVDRRAFDATLAVYNDQSIQALICCCCARICLQTARRSSIEFVKGTWFLKVPPGRYNGGEKQNR